jgi:hypothetical protein
MTMIEAIKVVLNCKWCHELLDTPIILPCYQTVCEKHETHFRDGVEPGCNGMLPTCKLCDQVHKLRNENDHFPANTIVQTLLEKEIKKLSFGVEYEKALSSLDELKDGLSHFEETIKNPDEIISTYFQDMRSEVGLIREELIERIDKCTEAVLVDVNKYEEECKANLDDLKRIVAARKVFNLEGVKTQLSQWQDRIGKLFYDKDLCLTVNAKHAEYLNAIRKNTREFLSECFLGKARKDYFDGKYGDLNEVFAKQSGFEG